MINTIKLYKDYSKRMLILSIIIGLLITITLPSTYFIFSWQDAKREAMNHSNLIEKKIENYIKLDPKLWQYNLQKFMQFSSEFDNEDIIDIEIYDLRGLTYKKYYSTSTLFPITISKEIRYNNQKFGYILIKEDISRIVDSTLVILLFFFIFGFFLSTAIYKYPLSNILKAKKILDIYIAKLNYLSYYDQLTKLTNRTYFYNELDKNIDQLKANGGKLALLYLDLDRFKQVNDSLGHSFGDLVLLEVAKRIKYIAGEMGTISRLGGDEFTIILKNYKSEEELKEIAEEIISSFKDSFKIKNYEIFVTTSIGISLFPEHSHDIETLVKNADTAMYQAKGKGKNTYLFYTSTMGTVNNEALKLEFYLRKALESDELYLHYQPKVGIESGEIKGIEALVRWNSPKLGIIPPSKFIPIAEETGLIFPIGELVLRKACEQNKKWQDMGFPKIPISINMSVEQFKQRNLIHTIRAILTETKLAPKDLEIEITESVMIDDEQLALNKIKQLKEMGVKVSIDDFGTGYSSLKYLKDLPIDNLKIDKSFIDKVPNDLYDSNLLASIISMSHSLNINVIAEGVENEDKLLFLKENSCDEYQGYYFSQPVDAMDFEKKWQNHLNKSGTYELLTK